MFTQKIEMISEEQLFILRKKFERYGFIYWTSCTKADKIRHMFCQGNFVLNHFFLLVLLLTWDRTCNGCQNGCICPSRQSYWSHRRHWAQKCLFRMRRSCSTNRCRNTPPFPSPFPPAPAHQMSPEMTISKWATMQFYWYLVSLNLYAEIKRKTNLHCHKCFHDAASVVVNRRFDDH